MVGIDGDIDAVDTSGRMRKVIRLGGSKGYRGKSFLFSEGAFLVPLERQVGWMIQ